MAKLYFKYGVMGSSKTVQALTTRFNYMEKGMKVWLIKPETDTRDGADIIKSRIGISEKADVIKQDDNIFDIFVYHQRAAFQSNEVGYQVIVADEAQFFTEDQIDGLRNIVDILNIPVICFGLRTDFRTKFFPGSKRLMEIADSISEIKTICSCGAKATVNMRVDKDGNVVTCGNQVVLGSNDQYISVCHKCYVKAISTSNI